MAWVKRNLGLVIGGAVAFVLMVLAGFYLWTKMNEDAAISEQLNAQTETFTTLLSRPVHPGNDKINNISLAKDDFKRLTNILMDVRAKFGTRDIPTNISNREFRAMLDRTVADLQKEAEQLGITLPEKDYWFTFAPQKQAVEFKNPQMLTHQLMDIKDICGVLYNAKIHDLNRIKRSPASSDDNNQNDFFDKKPTTNEFAITTPYEVTFQGFSSELGKVLEGFVNSKNCFVVKTVTAMKAPENSPQDQGAMPAYANPMSRYGGRYAAPAYHPAQPRSTRPPNVLLDENKLQFTLLVESVRLKPYQPIKPAAAPVIPAEQPQEVAQQ